MTDLLYISYDKKESNGESGLCVGRVDADGSHSILKMELDKQADILYKLLTDQTAKAEIRAESEDKDAYSRKESDS